MTKQCVMHANCPVTGWVIQGIVVEQELKVQCQHVKVHMSPSIQAPACVAWHHRRLLLAHCSRGVTVQHQRLVCLWPKCQGKLRSNRKSKRLTGKGWCYWYQHVQSNLGATVWQVTRSSKLLRAATDPWSLWASVCLVSCAKCLVHGQQNLTSRPLSHKLLDPDVQRILCFCNSQQTIWSCWSCTG